MYINFTYITITQETANTLFNLHSSNSKSDMASFVLLNITELFVKFLSRLISVSVGRLVVAIMNLCSFQLHMFVFQFQVLSLKMCTNYIVSW